MKPPPANLLVSRVILLTLCLLVFSGTLGLAAVWMRQEISRTANHSRTLQVQIDDVERRLDEVGAQVAASLNPDTLLRQNASMRLALATPRELQVVRVSGSAELRLVAKRNREVFTVASASFASNNNTPVIRFASTALR